MKIVILGSCRYEPYDIMLVPRRFYPDTEEGYKLASRVFYPMIDQADEVWVYAPNGIGEHTARDIEYAKKKGKMVRILIADDGKGLRLDRLLDEYKT